MVAEGIVLVTVVPLELIVVDVGSPAVVVACNVELVIKDVSG